MTSWTVPGSWTGSPAESYFNTHIRDNLNYLYEHHVVQVVNTQSAAVVTGSTQIPCDDTIPQNTEGFEVMTCAITPLATNSILRIDVVLNAAFSAGGLGAAALFQDSTAGALAAVPIGFVSAGYPVTVSFVHKMTAGTTSATTFKVRIGPDGAGTVTFNGRSSGRLMGGVAASSVVITEYKA